MTKLKCADCGYTFQITPGAYTHNLQHSCPRCEGLRIHRTRYNNVKEMGFGETLTSCALLLWTSGQGNGRKPQKWMTD
jgi:DNA-directed RNA polymerase subunit RPC12/RpoP